MARIASCELRAGLSRVDQRLPNREERSSRRHVARVAMSAATPVHDVDMDSDITNAVPAASDQATTSTPVSAAVTALSEKDAVASTTTSAATTSVGRKQPPPEKPSDTRRRSLVILSLWLIVLCLGLPIWWKTTAIPRANLPLDEMMDWADGKVSQGHAGSLYPLCTVREG